jgi:hypothetical protein
MRAPHQYRDTARHSGHADIKTTMVYTHCAPGANEAELVDGVFEARGTEPDAASTAADPRTEPSAGRPSAKRRST